MDKKMIRDCGLEEDIKRFQAITEYTFISQPTIDEDEGDDISDGNQTPEAASPVPPASTEDGSGIQQNTTPQSNDPMMDAGQQDQPPLEDMSSDGGESSDSSVDIEIDEPNDTEGGGEEEVTIDVDSLVKAQDETNAKIDSVTDVLQSFIKTVDMYGQALKIQNSKLAEIDTMLQRSNPSEEEILNMRSLSGAPFSQQPVKYWQDKQNELPNYSVMMDNSVSPADEQDAAKKEKTYDITVDDISDINTREINASFDEPFTFDRFVKF